MSNQGGGANSAVQAGQRPGWAQGQPMQPPPGIVGQPGPPLNQGDPRLVGPQAPQPFAGPAGFGPRRQEIYNERFGGPPQPGQPQPGAPPPMMSGPTPMGDPRLVGPQAPPLPGGQNMMAQAGPMGGSLMNQIGGGDAPMGAPNQGGGSLMNQIGRPGGGQMPMQGGNQNGMGLGPAMGVGGSGPSMGGNMQNRQRPGMPMPRNRMMGR